MQFAHFLLILAKRKKPAKGRDYYPDALAKSINNCNLFKKLKIKSMHFYKPIEIRVLKGDTLVGFRFSLMKGRMDLENMDFRMNVSKANRIIGE